MQKHVETLAAKCILEDKVKEGDKIEIVLENGELKAEVRVWYLYPGRKAPGIFVFFTLHFARDIFIFYSGNVHILLSGILYLVGLSNICYTPSNKFL